MNALALYNGVPVLRPFFAAAKGGCLRWWRYGRDTGALVEEALGRERWPARQWRLWQEERLAELLRAAAATVPYYRESWAERRRRGDSSNPEYLENWPALAKNELRACPKAFLADGRNPRWMFHKQTSGTTGTPLHLWFSRRALHAWYALFEARCRRWHGISVGDPYAMMGGQVVTPARQERPPFWVWNAALKQLYLSGLHVSAKNAPHYGEALRRYGVRYILGFPSLLNVLARGLLEAGGAGPRLRVVLANAEPLFEHQRRAISEAFGCPVRETYGMGEAVAAASECEHGRLHLWPDAGAVEVLDGGISAARGEEGDLVCTGFTNPAMPLIRYRAGDRGVLAAGEAACPCGRTLPVVARISGRSSDLLVGRDGRAIYWLNPVFYGLPLAEAQIVQESLASVRVRYVPAPGFTRRETGTIAERLRERLGDVEIEFERMDRIPRGPNGKFQPVVCLVAFGPRQTGAARSSS